MVLLAAITGVLLRGQDNNILTQIGLVVLVGLACKERDPDRRVRKGGPKISSASTGSPRGRTRGAAALAQPILVTSFAFILGVVPLVFAAGAGAEARQALGTAGVRGDARRHLLRSAVLLRVLRGVPSPRARRPGAAWPARQLEMTRHDELAVSASPGGEPVHDAAVMSQLGLAAWHGLCLQRAGTDIHSVPLAPPAAFDGGVDPALASTSPVDAWWTTFGDARMTALVEEALQRSPDVRQALRSSACTSQIP